MKHRNHYLPPWLVFKLFMSILIVLITLSLYDKTFHKNVAQANYISPLATSSATLGSKVVGATHKAPQALGTEPSVTPRSYIDTKVHADILWRVYGLESSFGKNDGCAQFGLYNGFGYDQNTQDFACYQTFNQVVDRVDAWFEKALKTHTLSQALCLYNQGSAVDLCSYAGNFMNL